MSQPKSNIELGLDGEYIVKDPNTGEPVLTLPPEAKAYLPKGLTLEAPIEVVEPERLSAGQAVAGPPLADMPPLSDSIAAGSGTASAKRPAPAPAPAPAPRAPAPSVWAPKGSFNPSTGQWSLPMDLSDPGAAPAAAPAPEPAAPPPRVSHERGGVVYKAPAPGRKFNSYTNQWEEPSGAKKVVLSGGPGDAKQTPPAGPADPSLGPGMVATADAGGATQVTADLQAAALRQDVSRRMSGGGYTPPRPARDQKVGDKSIVREDIPEDIYQFFLDQTQARAAGAAAGGDAAASALQSEALVQAKHAEAAEQQLASLRQTQNQRQMAVDRQVSELDAQVARIRSAADDDPVANYWEKKGSFGTFLAKVGIALGALGASLTRTDNQALAIVNGEIEREMAQQKSRLDGETKAFDARRGILDDMRQNMMSPAAADLAARGLLQEVAAREVAAIAAASNVEAVRLKGVQLASEISQQAAKTLMDAKQAEADEIHTSTKHIPASAGGYSRGKSLWEAVAAAAKVGGIPVGQAFESVAERVALDAKRSGGKGKDTFQREKDARERTVALPPELLGDPRYDINGTGQLFVGQRNIAKEKTEQGAALVRMRDNYAELKRLAQENTLIIPGEARAKAQRLIADNLGLARGSKLVSEANTIGEYDFLGGPLGGAATTDWRRFSSEGIASVEKGIELVEKQLESVYNSTYASPNLEPHTMLGRAKGSRSGLKLPEGVTVRDVKK